MNDYTATLAARGDDFSSNELKPQGSTVALRTDIFNWTRNQLIEAKASTTRRDIRMAIGQLADYAHILRRTGSLERTPDRAVLLVAKPEQDLIDLLASEGINVIWQEGDSFADNAKSAFV